MDGLYQFIRGRQEIFTIIESCAVMLFLYNSGLLLFRIGIQLASLFGNTKASLWLNGRKNWRSKLKSYHKKSGLTYWFHCSSLGEFEQGRPLIEALRACDSEINIILTFFSPSGYEVRKNYSCADLITYLPLDGSNTSRQFIDLTKPDVVFFIKYDYWFYYFKLLRQQQIPIFIISGIFRNNQHFFKWYGTFFRKILKNVSHFFLQDEHSAELLISININSFSVSGDTRFDRVVQNVNHKASLPYLELFKGNNTLLIAGSTWHGDELILLKAFHRINNPNLKLIIAPHDLENDRGNKLLNYIEQNYPQSAVQLYSRTENTIDASIRILILDTMGQLSSAYAYGDIAYVGGGFNKGIHNTLEPASFGIPVLFGPRHEKFREANGLIVSGGAFCINNDDELSLILHTLLKQSTFISSSGKAALNFILDNAGATNKITLELQDIGYWPSKR